MAQIHAGQLRVGEIGSPQVSAFQQCSRQVSSFQIRLPEIGTAQITAPKISTDEMGLTEVRLAQITPRTTVIQWIVRMNLKWHGTGGSRTGNHQQHQQPQK